jgi:hypothetical protein
MYDKAFEIIKRLKENRIVSGEYHSFLSDVENEDSPVFRTILPVRKFDAKSKEIVELFSQRLSSHPAVVNGHVSVDYVICPRNKEYVDAGGKTKIAYSDFFLFNGKLTEKGKLDCEQIHQSSLHYIRYDYHNDMIMLDQALDDATVLGETFFKITENDRDAQLVAAYFGHIISYPPAETHPKMKDLKEMQVFWKLKFG